MSKTLLVILGPTGVGKTDLSINIAKYYDTEIISSDSRQVYKELRIGTAVPDNNDLLAIQHHFIHSHSIHDYFSSWEFEQQAVKLAEKIFETKDHLLMVGGSMMYIDAVCKGIDSIPTISDDIRQSVFDKYQNEGLQAMQEQLKELDPEFYDKVDLNNAKRVIHAIEICIMSGKTYTSQRTNSIKKRSFDIVKIGLNRDRDELYDRINKRVDVMMTEGLEAEARAVYQYKEINSLNTVGYKELFQYFDGNISLHEAIELIKRNSRRYAKRQLSWFRRDKDINWFNPQDTQKVLDFLKHKI